VPTDTNWTTLTDYLGGLLVAGGEMKEIGTAHWMSPNTGATNSSGFTGLSDGFRFDYGFFFGVGFFAISLLPQELKRESPICWLHQAPASQSVERFGIRLSEGSWPWRQGIPPRQKGLEGCLGVNRQIHPKHSTPSEGVGHAQIQPLKPQPLGHLLGMAGKESESDPSQPVVPLAPSEPEAGSRPK
jgi:hypothetical protein